MGYLVTAFGGTDEDFREWPVAFYTDKETIQNVMDIVDAEDQKIAERQLVWQKWSEKKAKFIKTWTCAMQQKWARSNPTRRPPEDFQYEFWQEFQDDFEAWSQWTPEPEWPPIDGFSILEVPVNVFSVKGFEL
jgi:hypothetical protein